MVTIRINRHMEEAAARGDGLLDRGAQREASNDELVSCVEDLVTYCLDQGSKDNMTAMLVNLEHKAIQLVSPLHSEPVTAVDSSNVAVSNDGKLLLKGDLEASVLDRGDGLLDRGDGLLDGDDGLLDGAVLDRGTPTLRDGLLDGDDGLLDGAVLDRGTPTLLSIDTIGEIQKIPEVFLTPVAMDSTMEEISIPEAELEAGAL